MQPTPASATRTARSEPPLRTGAFADVATRWLLLWVIGGGLLLIGAVGEVERAWDITLSDEWDGVVLYLPVVLWIALVVVRRNGVDLGAMLRWPKLGWYWLVVAGMLVVQFLFSFASILLTDLVAPGLGDSLEGVGEGNLMLAFVGLVVLPPLVEEVLFRGVLIERFTVKWRVSVAVIVSAIGFGLLHADPVGAGVFGVITGLLYLRTGSLWPGILIHAVNNLIAFAAIRLAPAPAEAEVETSVGATVLTAGMLLLIAVPFLAWFIKDTWPARDSLTTYQRHELAAGLPPRTVTDVRWSNLLVPLTLKVTDTLATLSGPDGPRAVLPLDRVSVAYPSLVPGGVQVVVLLRDGSWSTLQAADGADRRNRQLAATINDRVRVAHHRSDRGAPSQWSRAPGPADSGLAGNQLRIR